MVQRSRLLLVSAYKRRQLLARHAQSDQVVDDIETLEANEELVDQVEQHHTSGIAASASVRDRRKGCFASGTTAGHHGVRRERAATGLLPPVQSRQAGVLSLAYAWAPPPQTDPNRFTCVVSEFLPLNPGALLLQNTVFYRGTTNDRFKPTV